MALVSINPIPSWKEQPRSPLHFTSFHHAASHSLMKVIQSVNRQSSLHDLPRSLRSGRTLAATTRSWQYRPQRKGYSWIWVNISMTRQFNISPPPKVKFHICILNCKQRTHPMCKHKLIQAPWHFQSEKEEDKNCILIRQQVLQMS